MICPLYIPFEMLISWMLARGPSKITPIFYLSVTPLPLSMHSAYFFILTSNINYIIFITPFLYYTERPRKMHGKKFPNSIEKKKISPTLGKLSLKMYGNCLPEVLKPFYTNDIWDGGFKECIALANFVMFKSRS